MLANVSNGSEGGRSKRGIMAEVVEWRREGVSKNNIRDKLKARGYQAPRIKELLKNTKDSMPLGGPS